MTRGARIAVMVTAAALLAVGTAWWFATFKRVEHWVTLPPRGEAAYNPLYALRLALRNDGVRVDSRPRLDLDRITLAPRDTVVLHSDPRALSPDEADALLGWAGRGGHLIVRMPPRSFARPVATDKVPLLQALPILPLPAGAGCATLAAGTDKPELLFCGAPRMRLARHARPLAAWGDADRGHVYARFAHDAGRIDVLAEPDVLGNGALRNRAAQRFVRELLAPNYGAGTVHLVYAASMPPLWRWLAEHTWQGLLPLLIALWAWLWMRRERLGPVLPSPPLARRSLLEHVQASGEHLHRYGRGVVLLSAAREAMLARLRRRDPLAAVLHGPEQAGAIVRRTGLPASEIAAALDTRAPLDGADLRNRISRLIALRNRL